MYKPEGMKNPEEDEKNWQNGYQKEEHDRTVVKTAEQIHGRHSVERYKRRIHSKIFKVMKHSNWWHSRIIKNYCAQ